MRNVNNDVPRKGLSLLEVIVALAIFMIAMIGLGQLISRGADNALAVEQSTLATQYCQSKLAEVASGVTPLTGVSGQTLEEDSDWQWSMDCSQSDTQGLWTVSITVSRQGDSGPKTTISRMVIDPSIRGSTFDSNTPSTSGSNSSSSGTPGS